MDRPIIFSGPMVKAILAHECDEPRGLESSDLYDDRPAEEPKCERCGHTKAAHHGSDARPCIVVTSQRGCNCDGYRPPTTEPASEGEDCEHLVKLGGIGFATCPRCLPTAPPEDAKALEDAIEQLTQDANFAEAIGQASDRAFAADLRTVINAARSREQYATKHLERQTPAIERNVIAKVREAITKTRNHNWYQDINQHLDAIEKEINEHQD